MGLKYASLGSGSQGNATVIASDESLVLIDCGFTLKETEKRLARLGHGVCDLTAVLVTHEHTDHIKGVGPLARKHKTPVYMTPGTFHHGAAGNIPNLCLIEGYQAFRINDLMVTPVAVPHDAREPSQFVFEANGLKLGILTDLGSVSNHVIDQYQQCHSLILEANHDPEMLANGPYPYSLKRRVGGQWGHLSNQQALNFLEAVHHQALQQLVIAHISQKNNCLELVQEYFMPWQDQINTVLFACQMAGFDWLDIKKCQHSVKN